GLEGEDALDRMPSCGYSIGAVDGCIYSRNSSQTDFMAARQAGTKLSVTVNNDLYALDPSSSLDSAKKTQKTPFGMMTQVATCSKCGGLGDHRKLSKV
ncbi:F-box/kelch-repeat protein, partial [Trifolium medium]|nr:F-box/kelch-repeat protein [Trifolium medium]